MSCFSGIPPIKYMNNLKMFLYLYCNYFISEYFCFIPSTDRHIKSATRIILTRIPIEHIL